MAGVFAALAATLLIEFIKAVVESFRVADPARTHMREPQPLPTVQHRAPSEQAVCPTGTSRGSEEHSDASAWSGLRVDGPGAPSTFTTPLTSKVGPDNFPGRRPSPSEPILEQDTMAVRTTSTYLRVVPDTGTRSNALYGAPPGSGTESPAARQLATPPVPRPTRASDQHPAIPTTGDRAEALRRRCRAPARLPGRHGHLSDNLGDEVHARRLHELYHVRPNRRRHDHARPADPGPPAGRRQHALGRNSRRPSRPVRISSTTAAS